MNSTKELKVKIRKLEKELGRTQEKLAKEKEKTACIKILKQRIRALTKSRDVWKEKLKAKQTKIKGLQAKLKRIGKAKGHQYPIWLVGLCVQLRVYGCCSYGGIRRILEILNTCFSLSLEKLPCENTIQNWVSKLGLFSLEKATTQLVGKKVSLILDESIRMGQEKLLLILSVPFEKLQERALKFEDVKVIYMKGATSWTGEKISKVIKKLEKDYQFKVQSILSDEDSKLLKASRLLEILHVPDISHAVATCLKRVFEETVDFKSFKHLISGYSSRGVNQALSYLCPPKQRTKARFMNLNRVVKWAKKLLDRFSDLNEKEATFFKDLAQQTQIISTLEACLSAAQEISLPFKIKGLSISTIEQAEQVIKSMDGSKGYLASFLKEIEGYLSHYQLIVDANKEVNLHVSSEIIESMFGKYKSKANNYALTGLTTLNLELPIYGMPQEEILNQIVAALETISLSKLNKWKEDNSTDSQIIKRNKFFKRRK